jgi:hypothetical protein
MPTEGSIIQELYEILKVCLRLLIYLSSAQTAIYQLLKYLGGFIKL